MKDRIRYFFNGSSMNLTRLSIFMHNAYIQHRNEKSRMQRWCNSVDKMIRRGSVDDTKVMFNR